MFFLCSEQALADVQKQCDSLSDENDELKRKLEDAAATIVELETQMWQTIADNKKLHETCNNLEKEMTEFRHQRNVAVDDRDEIQGMFDRRNNELERIKSDMNTLSKQLEAAVYAKCEAISNAEEVSAMKLTLEYKEKRLEQERTLMNAQLQSVTEDLKNRTEELLNMRRDNTVRSIQLEGRLTEKTKEFELANDNIKSLMDANNNLLQKIEEFNQKLLNEKEVIVNYFK